MFFVQNVVMQVKFPQEIMHFFYMHHSTVQQGLFKLYINLLPHVDVNPFIFIRWLSCPHSIHTSLTQNCLKLTFPGFPYNLFLVFEVTLALKIVSSFYGG